MTYHGHKFYDQVPLQLRRTFVYVWGVAPIGMYYKTWAPSTFFLNKTGQNVRVK